MSKIYIQKGTTSAPSGVTYGDLNIRKDGSFYVSDENGQLVSKADRLSTPRTINGVAFDGTQNIEIDAGKVESVFGREGVIIAQEEDYQVFYPVLVDAENTPTLPEDSNYMRKSEYDPDGNGVVLKAENANNGVFNYSCVGNVLTGEGDNGKFKADTSNTYTSFNINGNVYNVKQNGETSIDVVSGAWYTFVVDKTDNTINFNGGGGLSNSKLALATAEENVVGAGYTFYAGNKELKTGTAEIKEKLFIFKDGEYQNGYTDNWNGTISIVDGDLQIGFSSGSMSNVWYNTQLKKSGYTQLGIRIAKYSTDGVDGRSRTFYISETVGSTDGVNMNPQYNGVMYLPIHNFTNVYLLLRSRYNSIQISEMWLEK